MLLMSKSDRSTDLTAAVFFLIAVSFKLPWTAISSLLGQFTRDFNQPSILLHLNLAYFLPSMPLLLLQSMFQEQLDRRLGVPRAAALRFTLGLGGLSILCYSFPSFCNSPSSLLAATAAVGALYSLAFGTAYQLVARFPPGCTVALTTGFVSCGIVVLVCDLALKHGPYYSPQGRVRLFQCVALQCALGLVAAVALLRHNWRRLAVAGAHESRGSEVIGLKLGGPWNGRLGRGLQSRQGSGMTSSLQEESYSPRNLQAGGSSGALLSMVVDVEAVANAKKGHEEGVPSKGYSRGGELTERHVAGPAAAAAGGGGGGGHELDGRLSTSSSSSSRSRKGWRRKVRRPLGLLKGGVQAAWGAGRAAAAQVGVLLPLLRAISMPALALLLSVGSSMMAFPFFTYVPTSGLLGEHLPQALFYARMIGDIAGRLLPPRFQLSTPRAVFSWGCFKAALLVLLLPGLAHPWLLGGDVGLTVMVTCNWWLSGYINTGAYLVAPRLVPPAAKARAGGLMALCFQCSCFLGLLGAWCLQQQLFGWTGHHQQERGPWEGMWWLEWRRQRQFEQGQQGTLPQQGWGRQRQRQGGPVRGHPAT